MSIKKVIPIFIVLVLLAGLVAGILAIRQRQIIDKQAAPATTLQLTTSESNPLVDQPFDIDVTVQTNENLVIGTELYITFDPSFIQVNSVSPGSFWGGLGQIQTETIDNSTGLVSYVIFLSPSSLPIGPDASGVVATLNVQGIAESPSTTIDFAPNSIVAAVGADVGVNVLDTAIPLTVSISSGTSITPTITGVTGTPTATIAPTPTTIAIATPTVTIAPVATNSPTPTTVSSGGGNGGGGGGGGGTQQESTEIPLRITTPEVGEVLTDSTPTLRGTASIGSVVNIAISSNQSVIGATTADGSGDWTWISTEILHDGNHTVTVTGSSGSTSVPFVVNSGGVVADSGEELLDAGVSTPTIMGVVLGFAVLILSAVLAF